MNGTEELRFNTSLARIYSPSSGNLIVDVSAEVQIDTTTLDINATTTDISGTLDVGGVTTLSDMLVLPKTTNYGIKVDTASPTFGYHDLLNKFYVRDIGSGTSPNWTTYRGNIKQYQFAVNDEAWIEFHVPHDWVPGTDLFIHVHWSHIATTVTGGSLTWGYDVTMAKGYERAQFAAPINITDVDTPTVFTQYTHHIAEVQLSSSGGSGGTLLDTDNVEIDALILVRVYLSANNLTVSGGGVPDPFAMYSDLHYQSTNMPTKDKNYPFYT
jgi:hypothetical protein